VLGIAALAMLAALLFGAAWRRRAIPRAASRLPSGWRDTLYAQLPQALWVSAAQRPLYEARVAEFLERKRFVGCGGLELRDEMRVVVAGFAALLLLRPDARVFPAVRAVLLYPAAFVVPATQEPDELGLVSDEPDVRIGESWSGERVVLSWADVQAALAGDEVNVVVHEFAHQLDDEALGTEGAPLLRDYGRWSEVMQAEYERLRRHRRPPVLDPYGAESPAEFFGVVTEAFFQRPAELRQYHPALYALLAEYYRLDPVG